MPIERMIMPSITVAFALAAIVRPPREYWIKTTILVSSIAGCLALYTLFQWGDNQMSETAAAKCFTVSVLIASVAVWLARSKEDDHLDGDEGWGDSGGDDDPEDPLLPQSPGGLVMNWDEFDQQRKRWAKEEQPI